MKAGRNGVANDYRSRNRRFADRFLVLRDDLVIAEDPQGTAGPRENCEVMPR